MIAVATDVDVDYLLEARGLSVGYTDVPVVTDLHLGVRPGEVVAILGPNGAGKTTVLLGLAGELKPTAGEVRWGGSITRAPMYVRCREGMSFVTEEKSVIFSLTVMDNLRLGRGDLDVAFDLFPELTPLVRRPAGLLSGGEQQILTLARALSRSPRLLLADELSLGLAPLVVERLLAAVRRAADDGVAVLIVEQHVRQVLDVADRAVVLRHGQVELAAPAAELRSRPERIERAYLPG
jgi:branched-chain amino acid transport system ATP-binding protein